MTDHDRHVTGNYGEEHPDNSTAEDEAPDKCNRCTCDQEGYCKQLDEWLCEECLLLTFSNDISDKIAWDCGEAEDIDEILWDATVHTCKDSSTYEYILCDFPSGDCIRIYLNSIKPNETNGE